MKYLFTAVYGDNGELKQTENDVSVLNPQKSSFYDVLEREKTQKLTAFFLESESHLFGVNLENGLFYINGSWVSLNSDDFTGWPLRLIYYREVTRLFNLGGNQLSEPDIVFCIGFQTNGSNGKNVKRVLRIDESGFVNIQIE
jgi:hypothetical protein